jgi:hypothetical protein
MHVASHLLSVLYELATSHKLFIILLRKTIKGLQLYIISGTMTEDTAEYKTMIDLTSELRLAVRPELTSLTGSLLASRLISLDNDIELRDTAHSGEVERSARLVQLVQNKVQQNHRHYHSFTGILQGNPDQYGDILQQLEQAYQEQRQRDGNLYGIKVSWGPIFADG